MPSITEMVIRDQFSYLSAALIQSLPKVSGRILIFVGCGTSYYLAQTLALASTLAGQQAIAVPGAEWARRSGAYVADGHDCVVIGLSRSGTTTETVQAIQTSRVRGQHTVAISCEKDSAILTAADQAIYLPTDPREGIVMSVSASLMLLAGLRLCGASLGQTDVDMAAKALHAMENGAASLLKGRSHFVYLGAGTLYGIASEAALKVQEMSISYSQAFHPMEYRHGPISLIDKASVVTMLYSTETREEEALVTADVQAKGAVVIGLGGPGDLSIPLPATGVATALVMLPALQMLGEMVALQKGLNTEAPRHLTKVVLLGEEAAP